MENLLTICDSFDAIAELPSEAQQNKTLLSFVRYLNSNISEYNLLNCEFCDKKTYEIARQLAIAIDNNSVAEIKRLKYEYGQYPQFAIAKEFLNKKCKILWDVFQCKKKRLNVPKDAMKALGITNVPSLKFMLDECLKFYEKDNGSTTVDIILSILNNPNLDYSFDDIFKYLVKRRENFDIKFNMITVAFAAKNLDYNFDKIKTLGVSKDELKVIFKQLPLKEKFKNLSKFLCLVFNKY